MRILIAERLCPACGSRDLLDSLYGPGAEPVDAGWPAFDNHGRGVADRRYRCLACGCGFDLEPQLIR